MAGKISEYPNSITLLQTTDLLDVSFDMGAATWESKKMTYTAMINSLKNSGFVDRNGSGTADYLVKWTDTDTVESGSFKFSGNDLVPVAGGYNIGTNLLRVGQVKLNDGIDYSGTFAIYASGSERVRISTAGKVSIATTSTNNELTVNGDVAIGLTTAASARLHVKHTSAAEAFRAEQTAHYINARFLNSSTGQTLNLTAGLFEATGTTTQNLFAVYGRCDGATAGNTAADFFVSSTVTSAVAHIGLYMETVAGGTANHGIIVQQSLFNGFGLGGGVTTPNLPSATIHAKGGAAQSPLRVDTNSINNAFQVLSDGSIVVNTSTNDAFRFNLEYSGDDLAKFENTSAAANGYAIISTRHTSDARGWLWSQMATGLVKESGGADMSNRMTWFGGLTSDVIVAPWSLGASGWGGNVIRFGIVNAGSPKLTETMRIADDAVSIQTTVSNAHLNIGAGTTSDAQIRFVAGVAPTTPSDGQMWYDGTNLKMYANGSTQIII